MTRRLKLQIAKSVTQSCRDSRVKPGSRVELLNHRVKLCVGGGFFCLLAASFCIAPAHAGIPRGLTLMADEQDADAATGITIARGNAEIAVENKSIRGRADQIELNPVSNQIQFTGRAALTIGRQHYESDAVTCTLDFDKCSNSAPAAQPLPAPATTDGTAAITPR